jgi:hypothetical protein
MFAQKNEVEVIDNVGVVNSVAPVLNKALRQ